MLLIRNIDVYYGDLQAIRDVSLSIEKGEIIAFVGSNGAGKSTVMKTIMGLLRPRQGSILFEGRQIDKLPPYKIVELGISMVPEGRKLFPDMTVLENLEVGASIKSAGKVKHTTVDWIYGLFPILKARARQNAGTLSGGEQQMLAIGRALMAQPTLLMIDEMSLGLSPLVVEELFEVIQKINRDKELTILLVEQDVNAALSVASRGYVIENGRITDEGDCKMLACNTSIMEAYLGIKNKET